MTIAADIKTFLTDLGLNKGEIAAYAAALELGSGSASTIARASGLNRITAYEALKRLSKKGFVTIRAKKNEKTKYFTPVEYPTLIEKLESKKESISLSIKKAEALKSEMTARFSRAESKPAVLFYEGPEDVREVLNDTLKAKPEEIISFSSFESLEAGYDKEFLENYWKRRAALGIPSRGILPKTKQALAFFNAERNKKELRDVRFLSPELHDFKNEIDIYGDTLGIISLAKGSEHGIIIRSKSVAESFRSVFETLWQLSEKSSV